MNSVEPLLDFHPPAANFEEEILAGLNHPEGKRINSKWLYDAAGSQLFDRITQLEEYYPTRAELSIFADQADELHDAVPPGAAVIELGSGNDTKINALLGSLRTAAAYVPVEISRDHLERFARRFAGMNPSTTVYPVCADFLGEWDVPELGQLPRLVFFPGSTIGNFERETRDRLFAAIRKLLRPGSDDQALIGFDLVKATETLERAYDDSEGVSAAFARNALQRINRELGADFDPEAFDYRAIYNPERRRVEMYLVSTKPQRVALAGTEIGFDADERIHTENSYKFTPESIAEECQAAGLNARRLFFDRKDRFALGLLSRA